MSFLDDEITDALSYHLRDQGVLILHNEAYEHVEAGDDGVVLLRCTPPDTVHRKFPGNEAPNGCSVPSAPL
jgi:pyruvate/2-oxoglutarate dehydrogenase complex dihydrolipoamide dehydrogenase (E3) component